MCFLRIDENTLYILNMLFKTKDSGHNCPMVRIFLVVFLDITILRGIFGCEKREDLTQGRSIQGVSFLRVIQKTSYVHESKDKPRARLGNARTSFILLRGPKKEYHVHLYK